MMIPSVDWKDLGRLYSKKEIKSLFVTVGPRADRPCCSRYQTFPVLCSLMLKFWKAKSSFYSSHPKRQHLASACSWLLALERVHGYCCLRNYCYIQVTSLKGH